MTLKSLCNIGVKTMKIKAYNAKLKNTQHFGTDRSLIKKLTDKFGPDVSIGDLLHFRLSDFMNSGFTGKQTERIVKYLSFFGHRLPDYAYANKRSKRTNVDLVSSQFCAYDEDKLDKFRNDPFYMDPETEYEDYVYDVKQELDKWENNSFDRNAKFC